ncbi:hypothetical protein AGMMS50212_03840 [Spirochaetia bacterium]|nr:hypothetical protein AGMMS50212_03840 [Spirochaetia bacterium]
MRIIEWNELIQHKIIDAPSAMTIGVFDGVHRGHRALIQKITGSGLYPAAVSFRISPRHFFEGKNYKGDILPFEKKLMIFEEMGVAAVILIDFSHEFSKTSGRAFLKTLQMNGNMRYLAVGQGFRCGFRNELDVNAIKKLNEEAGVTTEIILPVLEDGFPVSSSRIREEIAAGNMEKAAALLGRRI